MVAFCSTPALHNEKLRCYYPANSKCTVSQPLQGGCDGIITRKLHGSNLHSRVLDLDRFARLIFYLNPCVNNRQKEEFRNHGVTI